MILFSFETKSLNQEGYLCGYASVFNVLDAHKDQVVPFAFSKNLAVWKNNNNWPKMLWQHNQSFPIGKWTNMHENQTGLWVEGKILLDLEKGRDAYTLLKAGIVDHLSIGFHIVKSSKTPVGRLLEEIDLVEISLVTFAANSKARVISFKHINKKIDRLNQNVLKML